MKSAGPITKIRNALEQVEREITGIASHAPAGYKGMYARGLSREGYAGGYAQALQDVLLVLGGTTPNTRSYWLALTPERGPASSDTHMADLQASIVRRMILIVRAWMVANPGIDPNTSDALAARMERAAPGHSGGMWEAAVRKATEPDPEKP